MSALTIHDLPHEHALDRASLAAVRGGNAWLKGLGPVANVQVNVGVSQNLMQLQNVQVNALNNVGVIGAGFGPLHLDVSPTQRADLIAAL